MIFSKHVRPTIFLVPSFTYFFRTSNCKKIHPGNEYGSLAGVQATIAKSDGLKILPQFPNPTLYSSFQEEPIVKSTEDMIQTQNSVIRSISRLDSIMSDLINESEENLSCQPLTNPYIPNSTNWTHESCHFGDPDSISKHTFQLDHTPSYENRLDILASYPFS